MLLVRVVNGNAKNPLDLYFLAVVEQEAMVMVAIYHMDSPDLLTLNNIQH